MIQTRSVLYQRMYDSALNTHMRQNKRHTAPLYMYGMITHNKP